MSTIQGESADHPESMSVRVLCRDIEITVNCGQGHQNFKWLANVVKDKYAKLHPQFKPEQFTPVNVYGADIPLYPEETIINSIRPGEKVHVELLGPKIGMNDPNFQRQKCMWELLAFTPKNDYVNVVFRFCKQNMPKPAILETGLPAEIEPPRLVGNFGPNSWFVPSETTETDDGHWEYHQAVPAEAEIFFIWLVNGAPMTVPEYETVEDSEGQELNCLHSGPPSCNYSELRVPQVTAEQYFHKVGNNAQDGVHKRKVHTSKVGKLQRVTSLSDEQVERMFNTDWRRIKLLDVLPHERDQEKCKMKLREFYDELREIFIFYARYSRNQPYMNILTFMTFCSQSKIPDRHNVNKARLTELFHRVNMEYGADGDTNVASMSDPLNPDNMFTRAEFLEAICRIALLKYDSQPIDFGITSVMDNHIRKHVKVPKENGVRHAMLSEPVFKVFGLFDQRLWQLFHKYSEPDTNIVVPKQFENIFKDKGIIGTRLSARNVNYCFALSQQEDGDADDKDLMEMNISEFFEAVARVAEKYFDDRKEGERNKLHEKIEDFLIMLFPTPQNFRKKKKRVTLGTVETANV